MLLYLIGVALVYQDNHSFAFVGLDNAFIDTLTLFVI